MIKLKRVYEAPADHDGARILVERLWPRGLSKEKAQVDVWMKEIAPSTDLRKWYDHDPEKWPEFKARYKAELAEKTHLLEELEKKVSESDVTFVFAAKDEVRNSAVVLKEVLETSG
ncbi:DUF488 family protein [candidate division KSB1 bacterium]|nr:DUF488 family protein [candidate division KSB1 bacterium]NIR72755.1 DUF488 family protein [candidate division KSB1 bacterium]NIS23711.1 DUF488 family protein [candidate division KSB1 bacterium]NIT70631.1 DUF488 family protein [candidate division KSB1 bacterium]NIU24359.1 DUF488 family protein [candidate division KSB1 bacterium]